MSALASRGIDGAAHSAASFVVALALGLTAHLLGTPLGHDGSLRDLLLLATDVALVAWLVRRGELVPSRWLKHSKRCWAIALLAAAIAGMLIVAEGAPNELLEFVLSSAVLVLTAAVAAFVLVLFAAESARVIAHAIVAIARRLRDGMSSTQPSRVFRADGDFAPQDCERFETRPRRGPPHLRAT